MALPCTHCRPASIMSHFEESIITGTREISGSEAIRLRNLTIATLESSMPSSMLMSITCAPLSTCCKATDKASSYFSSRMSRLNIAEPVTLLRSPTFTNKESAPMLHDSKPERRHSTGSSGIWRGAIFSTVSAIALMKSGEVPQQPPMIFRKPLSAHSLMKPAIFSGVSS